MSSRNFTALADHLARARIDFGSDSFKAVLVSAVPSEANLDAWDFRNDVTSEISGTGYTAGGFAVTAAVSAVDAANDKVDVTFTTPNPALTGATVSAVGCIIYKDTGVAANDPLVCFVDFNGTVASTNGNYVVTLSTPLAVKANPA